MKKNISINICGTVYHIDEDASLLLENYLQSMKSYFEREEGDNEIFDDIEHRVAELLWDYKQQGMEAVDIDMVKTVIEKIGNPAEIANDDAPHANADDAASAEMPADDASGQPGEESEEPRAHFKNRRIYRNVQDKMLGGVCSGLTEYFGLRDTSFLRLAMLILTLFLFFWWNGYLVGWAIPLLYMAMWIIVPPASTPEDRLRMKGRKVNPNSLKEQIVSESEEQAQQKLQAQQASQAQRRTQSGCLKLILTFLLLMLLLFLLCLLLPLFFLLFAFAFGISVITSLLGIEMQQYLSHIDTSILMTGSVAGIIVICIPIWFIISFLRHSHKPTSTLSIVSLIVTWMVALAVCIASTVMTGLQVSKNSQEIHDAECTRNGVRLAESGDWRALDEMGWTLHRLENVEPYIVGYPQSYAGLSPYTLKILRDTSSLPMTFRLSRSEYYDEGYYVLEAISRTLGKGIKVEVHSEANPNRRLDAIDPSAQGKDLMQLSLEEAAALPILNHPDSTQWADFTDDQTQWGYYASAPFHHDGGMIITRISAVRAFANAFYLRHLQLRPVEAKTLKRSPAAKGKKL